MPTLLPIILEELPTIVVGAEHLIAYVRAVRAEMQQNDEWTPELEQKFLAGVAAHASDPAYLPHKD